MQSSEIRNSFIQFFAKVGHTVVKSSSLIPAGDATLLFTNAGMVPFKDAFLGLTDLGYKRATSSQKCVRAGGKHNDLENVGFTARHHTFFEMLGNFSFGDYFKKEAIAYAYELVTQVWKIDPKKIRVTVYKDDDEAFALWQKMGFAASSIGKLGEADNFWAMGDTGPCGPCSEIYYDWGEAHCDCPPSEKSKCAPGVGCGNRFLEIWNLVFMQFNRDSSGKMHPLPKPSVDTGSGLERVAAVLQGKYNNYDTDVFQGIIQKIAEISQRKYLVNSKDDVSFRVIADHLRSSAFLIADGVTPSNEGRGYVLRRILRRAIRHGKNLNLQKPFIYELVPTLAKQMGAVYPELLEKKALMVELIKEEEIKFHETLHRGLSILEQALSETIKNKQEFLSAEIAFKLYDTFGFPLDLIQVISEEQKVKVDLPGFEKLMETQRQKSVWQGGNANALHENLTLFFQSNVPVTQFLGYEKLSSDSVITHLFDSQGKSVQKLEKNGYAVFEKTPFYAESGGQVGDKGVLKGNGVEATVLSTSKFSKCFLHQVEIIKGSLEVKKTYSLEVDEQARQQTAINHTATHILHAALRKVLGERVKQAGSLVEPSRLRFDFAHAKPLTAEEIEKIEAFVNDSIQKNDSVKVKEMGFQEAVKSGALAFFDEKYGAQVRVITVGDASSPTSVELCGGTHLNRASEIGCFKIISESSVASGVRRIEAITSSAAIEFLNRRHRLLSKVEELFNIKGDTLVEKVEKTLESTKSQQKELEQLKLKMLQGDFKSNAQNFSQKATLVPGKGIKVVAEILKDTEPKFLRQLIDQAKDQIKEKGIVLLATIFENKVGICVGITKDLSDSYDASKLIQEVAKTVGGTGGGRKDFAQAGGTLVDALPKAIETFKQSLS